MKTNGRIRELLATTCANDVEYGHRVIWPLLDYLGIPSAARRPEFQIENPFNDKQLRVDFLIHVGDIPMVTIEGEPHTRQFDEGYRQAKNYSKNFRPRQRDCPMREMTVPFLLVAAGGRAETYRAVARGINVDYELIDQDGKPAFLEWSDILAEAAKVPAFGAAPQQLELFGAAPGPVSEMQQVLKADAARQFFSDVYAAIRSSRALREKEDRSIVLFNRIIDLARQGQAPKIARACRQEGLSGQASDRVMEALAWYERQIEANEFSGAAVARGYRNFLVQPAGHGGHYFFTGTTQHRPVIVGGQLRYREVARYFTPTEIIQQMVRLAAPKSDERVIDITCGGGGFLAECVDYISQKEGESKARRFLKQRLVGIDDDPFCVSCSRELLTFMFPDCADDMNVFLHNCLYRRAPAESEVREDRQAERHLADGRYDLVLGNPPGNDKYSGSNSAEVHLQWEERYAHTRGGLMDHHCFVRRAVELARPDGGRICLILPEGLLARDNRGMPELRHELLRECELRAVISLPRVFKNNNAQMAVVYLARNPRWSRDQRVLMASVSSDWKDENGDEHDTDIAAALESLVDRYGSEVAPHSARLEPGNGMLDFPSPADQSTDDD